MELQHPSLDVSLPSPDCPECGLAIDARFQCPGGHEFIFDDAALVLMTDAKRQDLARRLVHQFADGQATGRHNVPASRFPDLPKAGSAFQPRVWGPRCRDLAYFGRQLATESPRVVLEVGPWNGWLTHHLCHWGHRVVAVDYFVDDMDGLNSVRHYDVSWFPIQMDLDRLDLLPPNFFDTVIFNRCLAFQSRPLASLQMALALLRPGGTVYCTGLTFYRDATTAQNRLATRARQFAARFGTDLVLNQTRGVLDWRDRSAMAENGMTFVDDASRRSRLRGVAARNLGIGMTREIGVLRA